MEKLEFKDFLIAVIMLGMYLILTTLMAIFNDTFFTYLFGISSIAHSFILGYVTLNMEGE